MDLQLEEVYCVRCHKIVAYADSSYIEDLPDEIYCAKCVEIKPKAKIV